MKTIQLESLITLGQLLKHEGIIASGGEAKWFLQEHTVFLNNEAENRRGKKLHNGDIVDLGEFGRYEIEYTK